MTLINTRQDCKEHFSKTYHVETLRLQRQTVLRMYLPFREVGGSLHSLELELRKGMQNESCVKLQELGIGEDPSLKLVYESAGLHVDWQSA